MNVNRYADFDEAFSEKDADPLVVRLYGQDWELPGVMPAAGPLKVARYMVDGREETSLTTAELLDLAADLIPQPILKQWLANGLDIPKLGKLVLWVIGKYTEDMNMALDDEGKAMAPVGPPA